MVGCSFGSSHHSGFYDHVPTPMMVPNPDGKNATSPDFNFTRLGVRIPTVMVSPWIEKGTVVHRPDGPEATSEFEHSSLSATLKKLFGIPNFLTKRSVAIDDGRWCRILFIFADLFIYYVLIPEMSGQEHLNLLFFNAILHVQIAPPNCLLCLKPTLIGCTKSNKCP